MGIISWWRKRKQQQKRDREFFGGVIIGLFVVLILTMIEAMDFSLKLAGYSDEAILITKFFSIIAIIILLGVIWWRYHKYGKLI